MMSRRQIESELAISVYNSSTLEMLRMLCSERNGGKYGEASARLYVETVV